MLVLTSSDSAAKETFVSKFSAGEEAVEVSTFGAATGKHDQIALLAETELTAAELENILSLLSDGGKVQVHCAVPALVAHFEKLLGLQGFLDLTTDASSIVYGRKPNLSLGSAFRRPRRDLKGLLNSESGSASISDADLLLQEDLKKPEIVAEAVDCSPAALGKKKACKNCSCGLKEAEEQAAISESAPVDTTKAKSSCGSVRARNVLNVFYFDF